MTILAESVDIVIGVDTHKHTHAAAVMNPAGGVVATLSVETTPAGYARLFELADAHGSARVWAIEGTGSYGVGLCRFLQDRGEKVLEVDRAKRVPRRSGAKTDQIDAVRAGREALARPDLPNPKARHERAALAVLVNTRRSAIDAAQAAQVQLQALIVTAPEVLRDQLRRHRRDHLIAVAAQLRMRSGWDIETVTYAAAIRDLARRVRTLHQEADRDEAEIERLVAEWRPDLLALQGVGPIVAATILCAWSHHDRVPSEAAFAALAGVAPIPASSGMTTRHRLNRGGDRQLNRALHVIALQRSRHDPQTRAYIERRRAEGKTDREIRRCLKRYIARRIYRQLQQPLDAL